MGAMASRITSLIAVYLTAYSGADQRKHQSSASLAFNSPVTGESPSQMASKAENVSIWWNHYGRYPSLLFNRKFPEWLKHMDFGARNIYLRQG